MNDSQLLRAVHDLADQFGKLQRRISLIEQGQRVNQLPFSSLDNDSLVVTDSDGNVRQIIGLQPDGTFTNIDTNGDPPGAPSTPIVLSTLLGIMVGWDGTLADASPLPADFHWVEIHISTVNNFTPDSTTLQGHLVSAGLFTASKLTAGTTYYAKLVGVNTSGLAGAESAQGSAIPSEVAANITAGTITAAMLAADIVVAGIVDSTTIQAATIKGNNYEIDPTGAFFYNGVGALGNPPVLAIVAPGVTEDPFANDLALAGNVISSTVVVGSGGQPQIGLLPDQSIPFGAGLLQSLAALTTQDTNEVMPGLIGSVLLNEGASDQQMAVVLTAPNAAGNAFALVLSADSDDAAKKAELAFGTVSVNGASVSFAPLATLDSNGHLVVPAIRIYTDTPQQQVLTFTEPGTNDFVVPNNVHTLSLVEVYGASGGSGYNCGAGAGAGEYAARTNVPVTPGNTYHPIVGTPGSAGVSGTPGTDGTSSSFTGDSAVATTAHGGHHGTNAGGAGGAGGTGSTDPVHHDGGAGHAGSTVAYRGGGGGGSGGPTSAGNNGGIPGGAAPVPGGSAGGYGSIITGETGQAGGLPGGGPGGGGPTANGRAGTPGMVRITFTPDLPDLAAVLAGSSGTDGTNTWDGPGLSLFGGGGATRFFADPYGDIHSNVPLFVDQMLQLVNIAAPAEGYGATRLWSGSGVLRQKTQVGYDGAVPAVKADGTVITKTSATDSAATKSWTIPANELKDNTIFRLTMWGYGTNGSTVQPLMVGIGIDGATVRSSTKISTGAANSGFRFYFQALLHCTSTGVSGTVDLGGHGVTDATGNNAGAVPYSFGSAASGGESYDTTAEHTFEFMWKWSSATGAPTITSVGSTLERLGP